MFWKITWFQLAEFRDGTHCPEKCQFKRKKEPYILFRNNTFVTNYCHAPKVRLLLLKPAGMIHVTIMWKVIMFGKMEWAKRREKVSWLWIGGSMFHVTRQSILLLGLMIEMEKTKSTHGSGCGSLICSLCNKHMGKGFTPEAGTPTPLDF